MSNKQDYNTKLAGERLWEKMAALFRGEKPSSDGTAAAVAFSEHSMAVAENFVDRFGNNIPTAILLADKEKKQYRKFAAETLAQAKTAIAAKVASLGHPDKDKDGKAIPAMFDNERYTVIAKDYSAEMLATVDYILDMLARAPDSDVLEEAQKKGRNNGRPKLLAEFDAGKYATGETLNGGNEYSEGSAYTSTMLWDLDGIMKGIFKLSVKCAAACDRDLPSDSGELYAVLTGDLPFPKSGKEYNIGLSPDIADLLVRGRLYHRISEAFKTKVAELQKILDEGENVENAEAMKIFQSGVFKDSLARTEEMKDAAARKKANAPAPVEVEKVPAVASSDEAKETAIARLTNEYNLEIGKGKKANETRLNTLLKMAAVHHPDYAERSSQYGEGAITPIEWEQIEKQYGKQVLTNTIPTPTAVEAA